MFWRRETITNHLFFRDEMNSAATGSNGGNHSTTDTGGSGGAAYLGIVNDWLQPFVVWSKVR
jgi:hypothetical protein